MKKIVATVELDGQAGRGSIFAEMEASDYYSDATQAYIIRVELPNGRIETPAISPQRTMDGVEAAVEASWGSSPWDLQWEEK